MANLTENSIWENGIYQLETDDPTLGGQPGFNMGEPVTGHANAQAQQLANRTKYLKDTHEAFVSDLSNTSDPTKGASLVAAGGGGTVRQALSMVSVAQFGAVGSGNETAAFTSAVAAAISAGHRRVFIPFASFTVTDNTDANSCEVYGAGTVLTGKIIGASEMRNILVVNKNSSDRRWHPSVKADKSNKLLRRISANQYQVYVRKKTKGYLLITLRNNQTTPAESLAATSSDITSIRVTSIVNVVDLLVGYTAASASLGTWTDTNLITGIAEAFDGDTSHYKYKQGAAGVGNYYEMQINVPSDGFFNVTFLRSSGSSPDVTVSANGVAVDSNFSLVSATPTLETRTYKTVPGTATIRVTTNSATGLVNLVGCNFAKMEGARRDVSLNTIGVYRNGGTYKNYIVSTSANDYAIRDRATATWGGSYHGGETGIATSILADGNQEALAAAGFIVCSSLIIRSSFNIDWTPVSGPVLGAKTCHEFIDGGYAFRSAFTGNITAESFFTTLYGANKDFTNIVSPMIADLSVLPDLSRIYFGRQNTVTYEEPTTKQRITITHSEYSNEDSEKGGAYIYKVLSEYNKYYYAPADRGKRLFSDVAAVNVFEFE